MNGQNGNRAMETVEKHNCRFSTVPTAPTTADKSAANKKQQMIVYTKCLTLPERAVGWRDVCEII
jgi:hypothetical protein